VLGVSADILAVAVDSPEPGVVDVRFVLTDGELPDAAMIALVNDSLSAETVRPLTDKVLVGAPDVVEYTVTGRWYALRADAALLSGVARAVERAVETYRIWQRSQPGRDINPSRLIALVQQAGAKRVELDAPLFTPLTATQVARETAVSLVFGGLEEE
jgi:phage-related baseplate assembly protein